jgi:hypothetical protein
MQMSLIHCLLMNDWSLGHSLNWVNVFADYHILCNVKQMVMSITNTQIMINHFSIFLFIIINENGNYCGDSNRENYINCFLFNKCYIKNVNKYLSKIICCFMDINGGAKSWISEKWKLSISDYHSHTLCGPVWELHLNLG